LIEVRASGICGTDIHILRGEYMGDYPVIPGHEFAGNVVAVGARVTRFRPGDRVAVEPNLACDNCLNCLNNRQNFCEHWEAVGVTVPGGMAEYVAVPEKAVFDIGSLPFAHGAFVEPLSCVIHGIQKAAIHAGDRVLIVGAGPIGILLLQIARLQGATSVAVAERNPQRAAFAETMGAEEVAHDLDDLPRTAFDVVVDATGVNDVMSRTLDYVRRGGTLLLFGVPPRESRVDFDAFELFRKGVTLHTSFTSVRNSYQAVVLLQSRRVDVSDLVSHQLALASFARGVDILETGAEDVRKVQILPQT
jgi:2-desacetyl-2-hydroxyethyl bacteriochlorophyllide A dehydrogenase